MKIYDYNFPHHINICEEYSISSLSLASLRKQPQISNHEREEYFHEKHVVETHRLLCHSFEEMINNLLNSKNVSKEIPKFFTTLIYNNKNNINDKNSNNSSEERKHKENSEFPLNSPLEIISQIKNQFKNKIQASFNSENLRLESSPTEMIKTRDESNLIITGINDQNRSEFLTQIFNQWIDSFTFSHEEINPNFNRDQNSFVQKNQRDENSSLKNSVNSLKELYQSFLNFNSIFFTTYIPFDENDSNHELFFDQDSDSQQKKEWNHNFINENDDDQIFLLPSQRSSPLLSITTKHLTTIRNDDSENNCVQKEKYTKFTNHINYSGTISHLIDTIEIEDLFWTDTQRLLGYNGINFIVFYCLTLIERDSFQQRNDIHENGDISFHNFSILNGTQRKETAHHLRRQDFLKNINQKDMKSFNHFKQFIISFFNHENNESFENNEDRNISKAKEFDNDEEKTNIKSYGDQCWDEIVDLLFAILYLGNIDFNYHSSETIISKEECDHQELRHEPSLKRAASLFEIDPEFLAKSLSTIRIFGDDFKNITIKQASVNRDALVLSLFQGIIEYIRKIFNLAFQEKVIETRKKGEKVTSTIYEPSFEFEHRLNILNRQNTEENNIASEYESIHTHDYNDSNNNKSKFNNLSEDIQHNDAQFEETDVLESIERLPSYDSFMVNYLSENLENIFLKFLSNSVEYQKEKSKQIQMKINRNSATLPVLQCASDAKSNEAMFKRSLKEICDQNHSSLSGLLDVHPSKFFLYYPSHCISIGYRFKGFVDSVLYKVPFEMLSHIYKNQLSFNSSENSSHLKDKTRKPQPVKIKVFRVMYRNYLKELKNKRFVNDNIKIFSGKDSNRENVENLKTQFGSGLEMENSKIDNINTEQNDTRITIQNQFINKLNQLLRKLESSISQNDSNGSFNEKAINNSKMMFVRCTHITPRMKTLIQHSASKEMKGRDSNGSTFNSIVNSNPYNMFFYQLYIHGAAYLSPGFHFPTAVPKKYFTSPECSKLVTLVEKSSRVLHHDQTKHFFSDSSSTKQNFFSKSFKSTSQKVFRILTLCGYIENQDFLIRRRLVLFTEPDRDSIYLHMQNKIREILNELREHISELDISEKDIMEMEDAFHLKPEESIHSNIEENSNERIENEINHSNSDNGSNASLTSNLLSEFQLTDFIDPNDPRPTRLQPFDSTFLTNFNRLDQEPMSVSSQLDNELINSHSSALNSEVRSLIISRAIRSKVYAQHLGMLSLVELLDQELEISKFNMDHVDLIRRMEPLCRHVDGLYDGSNRGDVPLLYNDSPREEYFQSIMSEYEHFNMEMWNSITEPLFIPSIDPEETKPHNNWKNSKSGFASLPFDIRGRIIELSFVLNDFLDPNTVSCQYHHEVITLPFRKEFVNLVHNFFENEIEIQWTYLCHHEEICGIMEDLKLIFSPILSSLSNQSNDQEHNGNEPSIGDIQKENNDLEELLAFAFECGLISSIQKLLCKNDMKMQVFIKSIDFLNHIFILPSFQNHFEKSDGSLFVQIYRIFENSVHQYQKIGDQNTINSNEPSPNKNSNNKKNNNNNNGLNNNTDKIFELNESISEIQSRRKIVRQLHGDVIYHAIKSIYYILDRSIVFLWNSAFSRNDLQFFKKQKDSNSKYNNNTSIKHMLENLPNLLLQLYYNIDKKEIKTETWNAIIEKNLNTISLLCQQELPNLMVENLISNLIKWSKSLIRQIDLNENNMEPWNHLHIIWESLLNISYLAQIFLPSRPYHNNDSRQPRSSTVKRSPNETRNRFPKSNAFDKIIAFIFYILLTRTRHSKLVPFFTELLIQVTQTTTALQERIEVLTCFENIELTTAIQMENHENQIDQNLSCTKTSEKIHHFTNLILNRKTSQELNQPNFSSFKTLLIERCEHVLRKL